MVSYTTPFFFNFALKENCRKLRKWLNRSIEENDSILFNIFPSCSYIRGLYFALLMSNFQRV